MVFELNPHQIRVLGCLVEKQLTTPDYYPLTLSALVTACNQKSNREPVMQLDEQDVLDAITELQKLYLVREKNQAGARVVKYEHKLSDTLTKQFDFSQNELGVLAVLFLRGPQTAGEIRTRTTRMCNFDSLDAVDETLKSLAENTGQAYVQSLARQPGRREIRYIHLFSPVDEEALAEVAVQTNTSKASNNELELLRNEVNALREEMDELKSLVNELIEK